MLALLVVIIMKLIIIYLRVIQMDLFLFGINDEMDHNFLINYLYIN